MKKDDIQISEGVLKLARKMAQQRNCTPDEMISAALEQHQNRLERWEKLQRQVAQYQKKNNMKPLAMDEIVEEVHAYRREQRSKRKSRS